LFSYELKKHLISHYSNSHFHLIDAILTIIQSEAVPYCSDSSSVLSHCYKVLATMNLQESVKKSENVMLFSDLWTLGYFEVVKERSSNEIFRVLLNKLVSPLLSDTMKRTSVWLSTRLQSDQNDNKTSMRANTFRLFTEEIKENELLISELEGVRDVMQRAQVSRFSDSSALKQKYLVSPVHKVRANNRRRRSEKTSSSLTPAPLS